MQFSRQKTLFCDSLRLLGRRLVGSRIKQIYLIVFSFLGVLFWNTVSAFTPPVGIKGELAPPRVVVAIPFPEKTCTTPKKLSLLEAILLALRTNPNVRSAYMQRISDKFALEVAHNLYVPQYTFNASATFQPGSKPQYTYTPAATLLTPFSTKLGVTYTGNYLGLGGSGSNLVATVTQPLLQGFGPKITMAPLEQAEFSEHTARLNLKNTIATTITQVIQNYYALVQAYNSLKVDELALQNSILLVNQYRLRIKAGQAAPLELAPQESQLASQRLQVTQDKNTIQQAYQALLTTIGLDPHSKLEIDKSITVDTLKIPSEAHSIDLALENNNGYLDAVYQLKQDELALLQAKDANRWTLNMVATKTVQPGSGSAGLVSSTGAAIGGETLVFNLTVPINNKNLEQGVVNAEVILEQQKIALGETKRALKATILTTIQSLYLQQQQVHQAQDAVGYAQQAYEVEIKKLRFGRSTILNVTQLQTSLTQAKQNLISQQISYINALAAFEMTLGITLDKWRIRIYY